MMSDDPSIRDRGLTEAGGEDWTRGGPVSGSDPARSGSLTAPSAPGDGAARPAAGRAAGSPGSASGRPASGDGSPAADGPSADGGASSAASPADADGAGPGTKNASGAQAREGGRGNRSFWRELPVLILVALVIALLIKTFVVQAFYIPSSSMEDTLKIGDKVLVNKLVYHFRKIEPGDIVVFDGAGSWDAVPPPAQPSSDPVVRVYDATLKPLVHSIAGLFGTAPGQTDYIKRVIGVPGDHVACCNAQGLVTVNGVALHEKSYLYPGNAPSDIHFHSTVPTGRLWVMGDHRFVSDDSRLHTADPGAGTIPENKVIGRAFLIVWPPSRWRVLPIPATFHQPGISAAGASQPGSAAADAAVARGVPVASSAPYLPLAAGFAGAVPLTWLQRRARIRVRRRRLRRRR
ncbi:MAG: signal peptidase I [Streptosporangiaceae bacterium]|jgi:signal peptidase I